MEFSGRLFLAAIEEDNTQRSLFRVRPLLSEEGGVSQEDLDSLGDEGFLRVVPDRGEQHTFKERMRELGPLCLIDLRAMPQDAVKVRSNKNYSPKGGEVNRYVIYSDAIRSLHGAELYEVVAEGRDLSARTSRYYLRRGGHIQGPFGAGSAEPAAPLCCIAPDNSRLFSVAMPDGRESLYYWPEPLPPMPAASEARQDEAGAEPIHAEKARQDGAEEAAPGAQPGWEAERPLRLAAASLRPGSRRAAARREGFSLSSVVDRDLRGASRPQELSATLRDTRRLRAVENPAEQLRAALYSLWSQPEGRRQAVDSVLGMDGAAQALCDRLSSGEEKGMRAIASAQLNSLEAERLALVVELDRLSQNREELLRQALAEGGKQAEELAEKREALAAASEALRAQLQGLAEQRDALLKELDALAQDGAPAAEKLGENCGAQKAARLISSALSAAGFELSPNDAMNLLILSLRCPGLALRAEQEEDALLAARLLTDALGAPLLEGDRRLLPGGDTLAFALADEEETVKRYGGAVTALRVRGEGALPAVPLFVRRGFDFITEARPGLCASREYLVRELASASREIPREALELLGRAEEALGCSLPLTLKRRLLGCLAPAQTLLEGGIAAALDYAFACFIIPFAGSRGGEHQALPALCKGMPLASRLL